MYSQFRTLISLLIVFLLAGAFLWGGSKLLNSATGAAPPPPTPTVPVVVEQPSNSPTARAGSHGSVAGASHSRSTPTPTPVPPTPAPSPTPKGPPKVFMTQALGSPVPAASFPLGLDKIYCWVRNAAVPPNTPAVTFYWTKDAPNGFISQFPLALQGGNLYTIAYGPSYINDTAGKYRCDVLLNQQVIGSAHFVVGGH